MTLSHYLHLRSRTLTPRRGPHAAAAHHGGRGPAAQVGADPPRHLPDNIVLPIDGTARLTGYGTLALRTGGSELKSQLTRATPRRSSTLPPSSAGATPMFTRWLRSATGWSQGRRPPRPSARCGDSLESAHSLEAGVPTWFSQVACALRLDPAKRMQTVPELMSALTDPNVANAMFEKGDNQISTRKDHGRVARRHLLCWSCCCSGA